MMAASTTHHSKPAPGPSKKRPRTEINEEDLRRSGRIRNLPAPIYTTFERDEDLGDKSGSRYVYLSNYLVWETSMTSCFVYRKSTKKTTGKDTATYAGTSAAGGVVTTVSTPPRSKSSAPTSANSLKALDAKMTDCASNHLGMVS